MASALEAMVALQQCWCEQLADTVANCCLTAAPPTIIACCDGFGWVRMTGAYPSVAFPQPHNKADRCRIDTWAITVEIGVARCGPEACGGLGETCCVSELDAFVALSDDFSRMRRVFTCCLPGAGVLRGDEVIPGAMRTVTEGQCITTVMTATLFVSDGCEC